MANFDTVLCNLTNVREKASNVDTVAKLISDGVQRNGLSHASAGTDLLQTKNILTMNLSVFYVKAGDG